MTAHDTRDRLLDAVEKTIRSAASHEEISVRRVVALAGTNVSSISYHFGSLEGLGVACAERVYKRVNALRLQELQAAIDRAAPAPPPLRDVIRALIGTSVCWSLDPESPYAVFHYLNHLTSLSGQREPQGRMVQDIDHHMIFVQYLGRAAPWFTETEIRWRLAAALGVRTQFTHQRDRAEVLTGEAFGTDPTHLLDELCDVIAAMFSRPDERSRPRTGGLPAARRVTGHRFSNTV
ncbi:MAG: TetR family transcriptional regulator [Pseudooceanicola sp.]|nr:TetR family transcriptional regulator [Pseudooceanicola sp.]